MAWPLKMTTLLKAAFTWIYYDFQKLHHLRSITQPIWYLFKRVPGCYGNTRVGTYNYSQSSDVSNLGITCNCFHFQPPTHLQSSTYTLSWGGIEIHMAFVTSTFDQMFTWQIWWLSKSLKETESWLDTRIYPPSSTMQNFMSLHILNVTAFKSFTTLSWNMKITLFFNDIL